MIALWTLICIIIGALGFSFLLAWGIVALFCWLTATIFSWGVVVFVWIMIMLFGIKITISVKQEELR